MSEYITLNKNTDFRRIYRNGKSYVDKSLVTYILKNKSNNLRYGITTSKKIGKAVKRNRCKRIIRAAYYMIYNDIKPGYDIIFVARGKTTALKSTDIYFCMKSQLKKAGILK